MSRLLRTIVNEGQDSETSERKIDSELEDENNSENINLKENDNQIIDKELKKIRDRRLNADTTDTRPDFLPVAADVGIEFYLAGEDPDGNPSWVSKENSTIRAAAKRILNRKMIEDSDNNDNTSTEQTIAKKQKSLLEEEHKVYNQLLAKKIQEVDIWIPSCHDYGGLHDRTATFRYKRAKEYFAHTWLYDRQYNNANTGRFMERFNYL